MCDIETTYVNQTKKKKKEKEMDIVRYNNILQIKYSVKLYMAKYKTSY